MGSKEPTGLFDERRLELLSRQTRSPEQREAITDQILLASLADSAKRVLADCGSSPHQDATGSLKVLYLLRTLRNMCASGTETVDFFVSQGIHEAACQVLAGSDEQLKKVSAQLLANLSTGSPPSQIRLWKALTAKQSWVTVSEHAAGPLAMLVINCCFPLDDNADRELDADMDSIVPALLSHLRLAEEAKDAAEDASLEILAMRYCYRTGNLPFLSDTFEGDQEESKARSGWEADVMKLLASALESKEKHGRSFWSSKENLHALCTSVLDIVDQLARRGVALHASSQRLLHESIRFLRTLTSLDETYGLASEARFTLSFLVIEGRLVEILLSMLAALGPIASRRSDKPGSNVWPNTPHLPLEDYHQTQPYKGYRSDIVAVLANVAYRRKEVQDRMQTLGGVELILANCQVDDESPFLREVALWAVRNLCEGNLSIQKQIEELQVVDVVETPEMQAAGVALQHDPTTGKMNISKSTANAQQNQE